MVRTAEDLEIAVVYFAADSHLFERMPPLGCLFAEFLCDEVKPSRFFESHICFMSVGAREVERIAAELSERGGG